MTRPARLLPYLHPRSSRWRFRSTLDMPPTLVAARRWTSSAAARQGSSPGQSTTYGVRVSIDRKLSSLGPVGGGSQLRGRDAHATQPQISASITTAGLAGCHRRLVRPCAEPLCTQTQWQASRQWHRAWPRRHGMILLLAGVRTANSTGTRGGRYCIAPPLGHAADPIHDHYRGLDRFAFPEEYAKFDSGIDDALFAKN